jgi:hypothetical protein
MATVVFVSAPAATISSALEGVEVVTAQWTDCGRPRPGRRVRLTADSVTNRLAKPLVEISEKLD